MFFKDQNGGLHFLSAEDIAAGETLVLEPVLDGAGVQELDGAGQPVVRVVAGPNTVLALLPAGCVEITDAEAHVLQNPPETLDQARVRLQGFVQFQVLDAAAQAAGYDDIKTAVTYADEPAVPVFQAQGRAFRAWRSLVWAACYELLAEAVATGVIPTEQQLRDELPALELPS